MRKARPWRPIAWGLVGLVLLQVSVLGVLLWQRPQARDRAAALQTRSASSKYTSTEQSVSTERTSPALGSASRNHPIPANQAAKGTSTLARARTVSIMDPDLPWRHAGLCVGDAGADVSAPRARYLATFVPVPAWRTTLYVHPDVPPPPAALVRNNLERIHGFATARLGLTSAPPTIYVHPSVESLREHSCASPLAVAYC
jgi:hypothetical protein